ncbi:MAG: hypothetical protein AAGA50_30830 [Pseudomonadota bacterium]
MTDECLVLKPDAIKVRVVNAGVSALAGLALGLLLVAVLPNHFVSVAAACIVSFALAAMLFITWGKPQLHTWIELDRKGLKLVDGQLVSNFGWRSLSRFTLLEQVSEKSNNVTSSSHYLLARLIDPQSDTSDADFETDSGNADICIPLDSYISYHRYSDRSEDQQAACRSPLDFADTVNAWRDFALNIEIGTIPTPQFVSENAGPSDLELKIHAKLVG